MGSTGLYIAGGLLSGVGTAITNDAEQRRAAALEALKRQYAVEDRDAKFQSDKAINDADNQAKLDALNVAGEQNRQTAVVNGQVDAAKIRLKGAIDLSNSKTLESLKHNYNLSEGAADDARDLQKQLKLAGVTVDHWEVSGDGRMVAFNKMGDILHYSPQGVYVPPSRGKSSDDEGDSISGERASRGAAPAAAPAPDKPASAGSANVKAQALAQLGNIYMQVAGNPARAAEYRQKYPAMFDASGKLLPKDELIARVNQRYGG